MGKRFGRNSARRTLQLDERLRDYSAVTRVSTAADTLRGRLGNWPKYAAVAGSALAMATGASASIITGTINGGIVQAPHTSKSNGLKTIHFTSVGLQLQDLVHLKASSGASGANNTHFANLQIGGTGAHPIQFFEATSNTQFARLFGSNSKISAGVGPRATDLRVVRKRFSTSSGFGQFKSGQTGFAGMALETTQGNHFNYGWIELKFLNNPTTGMPQVLEALGFGIETTQDTAIETPTPEPGTMGLAVLAAGALGVAALRRRKALARQ